MQFDIDLSFLPPIGPLAALKVIRLVFFVVKMKQKVESLEPPLLKLKRQFTQLLIDEIAAQIKRGGRDLVEGPSSSIPIHVESNGQVTWQSIPVWTRDP